MPLPPSLRPIDTYYGGKLYKKKKGSMTELLISLLGKPKKV